MEGSAVFEFFIVVETGASVGKAAQTIQLLWVALAFQDFQGSLTLAVSNTAAEPGHGCEREKKVKPHALQCIRASFFVLIQRHG